MKNLVKELYQILESGHICLVPFKKKVQYFISKLLNMSPKLIYVYRTERENLFRLFQKTNVKIVLKLTYQVTI